MNMHKIILAIVSLGLGGSICLAEAPSAGSEKAAMVAEMQTAVNTVAIKHGNIPFTQIFTNEPQRAAAVRQRFMEIERSDALQKQIQDMGAQVKALQDTIQANEAIAAELERRITARKVELASLAPAGAAGQ